MKTHKIHNIALLKEQIKTNAADTRAKREEARTLTGMDRWYAQRRAEFNSYEQRCLLLAYGYLRGKSISQMESPYSDPDEIPSADEILNIAALPFFNQGPEGKEHPADWDEFTAHVEEDLKKWKAQVTTNRVLRDAGKKVA